jgi:hypothetical protein
MRYTNTVLILAVVLLTQTAGAQEPQPRVRSTAGPRLGVTYLGSYRPQNVLTGKNLTPFMTQFGWHSEQAVFPFNGGPTLVVEEVLLVGGVEQRALVPSATFLVGVRARSGVEFGLGPNLSLDGAALAFAGGKSFNLGGVSIPVDLAAVSSQGGVRMTLLLGYAVETPTEK